MLVDRDSYTLNNHRIPGLQEPLISRHLDQACKRQNKLPTDDILLQLKEKINHLPHFKDLFERYKVNNLFAVHFLHRHSEVAHGFNMVGRTISDGRLYWTRKVANNTLDTSKVCGRKFMFDEQGWFPCEFHEGSAPDLSKVKPEFFTDFAAYLVENDLTSTFGLEYIVPELLIFNMLENNWQRYGLVISESTSVPLDDNSTVITSWGWLDSLRKRELRCVRFPDGHKKVNIEQQESLSDEESIAAFERVYLNVY
ncbi:hypothetical protein FLAG1_10718 [Fusarium langsethiae]|jgi:hypothetical protein|uniref:Uncharacterized protein n=1 Tax=Fusarium langsethiae TaxID=179993 RepID=A0A0N0DBA7_FUSLA|nr:hypothetical protein FLAG1_10718 [Fusarium langsethiae]